MAVLAHHQEGRLEQAEAGYRRLLDAHPDDADALHFLGMLRYQQRQLEEGIRLIRRSLELAPRNAHAWNNLGNVLAADRQEEAAVEAYLRALSIDFEIAQAWQNLGSAIERSAEPNKAIALFSRIIESTPELIPAYEALGRILRVLGMTDQALAVYRRWVELEPDRATALHLLAANSGVGVPQRAADRYVVELFDGFAADFDQKLTKLEYRAPSLLAERIRTRLGADRTGLAILDAGCGTGWCGPLLRAHATRLVGVDLSPKMIAKARERGAYDELAAAELCAFMRSRPAAFDLVISADTLVYFGDLTEAVSAAFGCLRPGGLLAFTVEAWLTDESDAGERIQPNGRYQHSAAYLRGVLGAAGFRAPSIDQAVLRKELGREVAGFAVLAGR
jgi:predicted TPR repeat methyltransferase